jgi:HEAT repeat protein
VRLAVGGALGKIGDARAVEPLIAVFGDKDWRVDAAAVTALGQIGTPAVESLIVALKDKNEAVHRAAAAEALGKIGDPQALEPLIATIEGESWDVRRAAAAAMVAIYESGKLNETEKARLLAQRGAITRSHYDQREDYKNSSDCTDHVDSHADEGIGVAFPM